MEEQSAKNPKNPDSIDPGRVKCKVEIYSELAEVLFLCKATKSLGIFSLEKYLEECRMKQRPLTLEHTYSIMVA